MSGEKTTADIVYEVYEAPLDPVEFDRRVAEIIADDGEKATIAELVLWFRRRYPTVEARLAYAQRHARNARRGR